MRKLLFIIVIFSVMKCFAQDPQLFENTWYLQKVVIDDVDYFPPSNNEVNNVPLNISMTFMETTMCGSLVGDFDTIDNTSFSIINFVNLIDNCVLQENIDFKAIYFNGFYNWQLPNRLFDYNIVMGTNNSKILTLTNDVGDQAIYGDSLLSNNDFDSFTEVLVYPNPSFGDLFVKSNAIMEGIRLFEIGGKVVLNYHGKNFNNSIKLDLSSIESGIYFMEIITEQGRAIRKIIKK